MSFGLKAGVNFANYSTKYAGVTYTTSSATSFNGGVYVSFPIGSSLQLQPELFYSGEGAKDAGSTLKANYINLPVLVKFAKSESFSAYVGPQIGFLMSAKSGDTDVKSEFKSTQFSGVVGVSYMLDFGLGFDARYQIGLGNISSTSGDDIKSNVLSVGLVYKIK